MSEKGDWKNRTAGIDPKFGAQGGGPDDQEAVPIEFYAPPGSPTILGLGAAADALRQQGVIVRDVASVAAGVAGKVIVAQNNADPLARTVATGSSPLASTQTPVESQVPKEGGFNLLQFYYFLVGNSHKMTDQERAVFDWFEKNLAPKLGGHFQPQDMSRLMFTSSSFFGLLQRLDDQQTQYFNYVLGVFDAAQKRISKEDREGQK